MVLGMRSSRIDDVLKGWEPDGKQRHELNVPLLVDGDIRALLAALASDNKLGSLRGKSDADQVRVFKNLAGRQILVAMIKATLGEELEAKASDEYANLRQPQRTVYALLAIATEMPHGLLANEILVATGHPDNSVLAAISRLEKRGLILGHGDRYQLRHRTVAELVTRTIHKQGQLLEPYTGLAWAVASRFRTADRESRQGRMVIRLLSHERVRTYFKQGEARQLYDALEEPLRDNYHYWLQRGSYEVKYGSIRAAGNYSPASAER